MTDANDEPADGFPPDDGDEACCVCSTPAVEYYDDREDMPSCGRASCELRMQVAIDYMDERGG